MKRLSTAKQESQKKNVNKAVKDDPPPQRGRRRQKQEQPDEEEEEEEEKGEEDKEEVLSQSLRKRDKNIQENKAMVINPSNFLFSPYPYKLCISDLTLAFSVVVLQLAKLFADLSTMADLTLPTTPQVSFSQTHNKRINVHSG